MRVKFIHSMLFVAAIALAASPARSETASEILRSGMPGQYYNVKRLLRASYKVPEEVTAPGRDYSLSRCVSGADRHLDKEADPVLAAVRTLADEIVGWSADLAAIGYPAEVWQEALVAYETDQVRELKAFAADPAPDRVPTRPPTLEQFVEALERHRAKNPQLPQTSFEACDTRAGKLALKADPADGEVLVIPAFAHRLCSSLKLDAKDSAVCDWWRAASELDYAAALPFLYRATWPDGVVREGRHVAPLDAKRPFVIRKPAPAR
jgi:hypothetical protein